MLRVWDTVDGSCQFVLWGHEQAVTCLSVLADDIYVVSGSRDHILRVWDINTGDYVYKLDGHTGGVTCLSVLANAYVVTREPQLSFSLFTNLCHSLEN